MPTSCKEALQLGFTESGIQRIYIPGNQQILEVYCDQTTDNGGWMVFQRRSDGSENFYRTWVEYQGMFGNLKKEFWLGNENLHTLTRHGDYELRIEFKDCDNVTKFAKYSSFSIGSAQENYALNVSGFSGSAGDSLDYHNGAPFNTKDTNHGSYGSCAVTNKGAWWYKDCFDSNLNGEHFNCREVQKACWATLHDSRLCLLKSTEMKFRPRGG
uniref:Fibrinogen C-terminal domain-containing protein n=1 Tax=Ciona savignyi TaxID=51511 RepID=H2Y5I0_CIOSA